MVDRADERLEVEVCHGGAGIEGHDLPAGVHAGVGATGHRQLDLVAEVPPEGARQLTGDRAHPVVGREAVEPGPVVGQHHAEPRHAHRLPATDGVSQTRGLGRREGGRGGLP